MKQTHTILLSTFWGILSVAALELVLFETGILESGLSVGNTQVEFTVEVVMELMTLANIWFALRLFKMNRVKRDLESRGAEALKKWGFLRLYMLGVPLVANVLFYELFLKPTFGYLAIILLICLPFVYPSLARCESEVTPDNVYENEEVNHRNRQL